MDTAPSTPSAKINSFALPEIQRRLEAAERGRGNIAAYILTLRVRMNELVEEDRKLRAFELAAKPEQAEDLLGDPSYESDSSFNPSDLDYERRKAFEERDRRWVRARADLRDAQKRVGDLRELLMNGPTRIATLQGEIDQINGSIWRLLGNAFTGAREQNASESAELQTRLASAPENLTTAEAALISATARAAATEDKRYDPSLHDAPASVLLPRSQQSILLSFDSSRLPTVTVHLPSTPDERDFSRVIEFNFDEDTLRAFMEIVGMQINPTTGVFDTIEENIERSFDFREALVPFPLEIVEIDDSQQLRLPQVVWERFGSAMSA